MPDVVKLQSANSTVVFDLLDELRLAWERILNDYGSTHGPVMYLDALMAAHNFHKLAIHHVIDESEMDPTEAELLWRVQRDTFVEAVNAVIKKLRVV